MPLAMVEDASVQEIEEALGYVTETMRTAGTKDRRAAMLKILDDLLDAKIKAQSCASR